MDHAELCVLGYYKITVMAGGVIFQTVHQQDDKEPIFLGV